MINHPSNDDLMIFSDGMVKSQVYLKDFEQKPGKKSFYSSLFQIYPSFTNKYKNEALDLKEDQEDPNQDPQLRGKLGNSETIAKPKSKTIPLSTQERIFDLKKELTSEYKANLEHFEKVRNTSVSYDTSIQFLHLASNKFLAYRFVGAELEKENYRLELVDVPSEATTFKILPSYKHQREHEGYIYYRDLVYIVSAQQFLNKTAYMRCSYQEPIQHKKSYETQKSLMSPVAQYNQNSPSPKNGQTYRMESLLTPKNTVRQDSLMTALAKKQSALKNALTVDFGDGKGGRDSARESTNAKEKKKEVNMSLSSLTRWRINVFSTEDVNDNFLSYGEIIWANHAEENASMIARKEKNEFEVDFIKTVASDNLQQYSGNTNGMWIIENENYRKGGFVKLDDRFRLKHFSSGQYLSLTYRPEKKRYELKLDPPTSKTENSLFKFVILSTAMSEHSGKYYNYISKEAFTRIQTAAGDLWLHVEKAGDKMEAFFLEYPLDDDIFKLVKANTNEVWETRFLISCFPILHKYQESLGQVVEIFLWDF